MPFARSFVRTNVWKLSLMSWSSMNRTGPRRSPPARWSLRGPSVEARRALDRQEGRTLDELAYGLVDRGDRRLVGIDPDEPLSSPPRTPTARDRVPSPAAKNAAVWR